jgi:hypothetical protein
VGLDACASALAEQAGSARRSAADCRVCSAMADGLDGPVTADVHVEALYAATTAHGRHQTSPLLAGGLHLGD